MAKIKKLMCPYAVGCPAYKIFSSKNGSEKGCIKKLKRIIHVLH